MRRATDLSQINQALNPRPLRLDELDEFFVETSQARDPFVSRRAEIADVLRQEGPVKVLLVGHSGSGKSTELVKLQQEHQDRFVCVAFSLIAEAQVGHASIETILVLTVEAMAKALADLGSPVEEATLQRVYNWFSEAFEITERDLELSGALGAGADAAGGLLGKLLGLSAYLKADIKTGSRTLNKVVAKENRRLSELSFQVNLLIKEAVLGVREQQGKDLLLMVEDLDKCSIEEAESFFIQNPAPLAGLPCKAVLTAPISLLCNPRSALLESYFELRSLPMIKLYERNGDRAGRGWETIREILGERLDLEALIDPDALELAIEKTGGVLRHLFRALDTAAFAARQAERSEEGSSGERIILPHVRYGLNRLKSDLLRRIGVVGLPEEFEDIDTADLYARLREILEQEHPSRADSDEINLLLLQTHALIEYNGEGWHRIHPLIAEHLEE